MGPLLTRRRFLFLAGTTAVGTASLGAYARWIEPYWLEFVHRRLPIRNLPDALVGTTLVHVSDVHVGREVDDAYLIESFERIASLKADFIVLTGDFVSSHPSVFPQLTRVFKHFPTGRRATIAVLGNHDYGPAWGQLPHAEQLIQTVADCGITVLRNQFRDVDGLQIVGLDDWWAGQFHPERVLPSLDPRKAAIVLTHNPDTVDLAGWGSYNDWILCGHTHGGQCKPPFLPPPILPVRNRRYTAGEFDLAGGRRLYINRGLGHLKHVRFNVRPEVTVFELARA